MDLLIDVDNVEPTMTLSRAVTKNGRLLLPAGRKLNSKDIEKLKEWKIQSVYVSASPAEKIA